ncbi:MAG: heat shock protein HspQ [Alphaproteobacteria bacterium]|nr:heat shock protein HspQ [Alphaproteobacteria bacterium]
MAASAKFEIGQLIQHRLFGYRGVIADADPGFQLSDEWYAMMARTQPPKDQPWYHVLVHDTDQTTYVAERNLEPDESAAPIRHPAVTEIFETFAGDRYHRRRMN